MAAAEGGYLKLLSNDKHVFIVEKRVASVSGFIRTMLASNAFKEGKGEIDLPDISAPVLERTITYWMFKVKYHNSKVVPEFVIPEEMALDVLIAADFLQC